MLLFFVGGMVSEAWGNARYFVVNNKGNVVLTFDNNTTKLAVHDKAKSPFANNWRFYKAASASDSDKEVALTLARNDASSGAEQSEALHTTDDADNSSGIYYVRYDYDTSTSSTININGGVWYKVFVRDMYLQYNGLNANALWKTTSIDDDDSFLWKFISDSDPYDIHLVNKKGMADSGGDSHRLTARNVTNMLNSQLKCTLWYDEENNDSQCTTTLNTGSNTATDPAINLQAFVITQNGDKYLFMGAYCGYLWVATDNNYNQQIKQMPYIARNDNGNGAAATFHTVHAAQHTSSGSYAFATITEPEIVTTYHIINMGRLNDDGTLGANRTEALTVKGTGTTVQLPAAYKSPIATGWTYYKSGEFTETDGVYSNFTATPSLSEGDPLPGGDIYVTYRIDAAAAASASLESGWKYNIQRYDNSQYVIQSTYNGDPNVGSESTETPTDGKYVWTMNIADPYQITLQTNSSSYNNYFLSMQSGASNFGNVRLANGLSTAKSRNVWAFALLNGDHSGTYKIIVADNYTETGMSGVDELGHGYLNYGDGLRYCTTSTKKATDYADFTFTPANLVTYHVVNKSNAIAISKAITPASGSITMPDDLKTPYITDNNNYKFFSTQADAYAYSNAANDAARATAATKAISGTVHAGQVVYVGYYYDESAKPTDLPILDGSVWYQMINNGTKYWKGVWNSNLGNTSPDKDTTGGSQDEYLWKYTGDDPYAIYVSNKWLNNEHNGGNDAELLRSGWNNGGFYHANYATGTPHGGTPHMILTAGVSDGSGNAYYNLAVSHPSGPMETTNYYVLSENCRGYQTDTPHPRYHNSNNKARLQFRAVAMGNFRFHLFTHVSGTELTSDITADYSTATNLITLPSDLVRKFASSEGKYYTSYSGGTFSNAYTNYHDMWLNGTHHNEGEEDEYVDIYVDYTTSMPFTVSADYEHAEWYRTYNNNKHYAHYDGSQVTSGSDSYALDYQFAFIGDPYEMKIINRQAGADKYLGVAAGSSSGTIANFIADSGDPIITWELVDDGFEADEFALRQYGTASSPMYCAYSGGTTPLRLISTTTRIKAVALPEFTYTYNIVDNAGRIAIKYTLKSDEKLKPTTSLVNNYTAIPAAIRSPYLAGETVTFYATATQRVDGESNPVTDADGRAVYNLTNVLTETPVTDGANIYVRYTNTALESKPLHLHGVRGFDIKVNGGHYLYDNGSGTLDASTTNLNDRHHLWYFKGLDPYAVEVENIGGEKYLIHDTSGPTLSYSTAATGRYFILMQYADYEDSPTNDVIRAELMAATGEDLGGETPANYYSVGATTGGAPNLYANTTGYEHGDASLKLLLTVGHVSVVYDIVDKQGKIVVANIPNESATTPSLPAAWQSPLVKKYYYWNSSNFIITGSGSAATYTLLDDQDEIEGITEAADGHVYVTYDVKTSSDDGYIDLNEEVIDPTARVDRSTTDKTQVRDAALYGKMYLLHFLDGEEFYQENGDKVMETKRKAIYPYTNGDGNMYIYGQEKWNTDNSEVATTRTRWPWFLISSNNDPYHVTITSWMNSHSRTVDGVTTNYYNYLRTYKNGSRIITASISDDPLVTTDPTYGDPTAVPSEYMILGTSVENMKLLTSNVIDGEHQTVNTLEQYWKTWETISKEGTKSTETLENTDFTDKGITLNKYSAWAYARPIDPAEPTKKNAKQYGYGDHWFQTVSMGDGTLKLDNVSLDGALVLLDNHGWEIMRRPIAKSSEDSFEAKRQALKLFDSPMVEAYHFWTTGSKATGYHRFTVANQIDKTTITSLADFPQDIYAAKSGVLSDLYVTYDVKPMYADAYEASSESATAYLIKQDGQFAKDNGGTTIGKETISDVATATDQELFWYVQPNTSIDSEMGYTGEAVEYTDKQKGFDPYNLQIKNKSTNNYLKTRLTTAKLGGTWTGEYGSDKSVTLSSSLDNISANGNDNTTLHITNATFMAVQDANGNMRLMPRFDHTAVVTSLNTIDAQLESPAPVEDDGTGAQTVVLKLNQTYTYIIMDNEGREALRYTSVGDAGPMVPLKFASPLATDFTFYQTKNGTGGSTEYSNPLTTFSGISMGSDPVYVRYEYAPTADTDGLLKGTWYNAKLNGNDVKVTASGIAKELFTNDDVHRWRFMQSAVSNADPYAVTLWNGTPATETSGNRYIILKPATGVYALMQAGNSSTTEYMFLDGESAPAINAQADYVTLGAIAATKYLTLTPVLASSSVTFKIVTNTGHVALTSDAIAVTADAELDKIMPNWMKSPLMKSSAYTFYPGKTDNGDGTITPVGVTTNTPKVLDNGGIVYVRYVYDQTTRQASALNTKSPTSQLSLSGKAPIVIYFNNSWRTSYQNGDGVYLHNSNFVHNDKRNYWYLWGDDPYEIKITNFGIGSNKFLSVKTPESGSNTKVKVLGEDENAEYDNNTFMILTSGDHKNLSIYVSGSQNLVLNEYFNYINVFNDPTSYSAHYNAATPTNPNPGASVDQVRFQFAPAVNYHIITNKGVEALSAVKDYLLTTVSVPERLMSPLLNLEDYTYYTERPVWDDDKKALVTNEKSVVAEGSLLSKLTESEIGDIFIRYAYNKETCPTYIHNDKYLPTPSDGVYNDDWYVNTYLKTRDTGSDDYEMVRGLDLSGETWYNMTDIIRPGENRGSFTYYDGSKYTTTGSTSGIMNINRPTVSSKGLLWRFEGDDPYAIRIFNGAVGADNYVQNKEFALVKFYTNDYRDIINQVVGWWFVFMETGNENHILNNNMTIWNVGSDSHWKEYGTPYYNVNNSTFCPGFYKAPVARKYRYHAIRYNGTSKVGETWTATMEHDWLMPLVLEDNIARLYCKYEKNTVEKADDVMGSKVFDTREALEASVNAQFYRDAAMTKRVFDEDGTTHAKTYDVYPAIDGDAIYDIYFKYQVDAEAKVSGRTLSELTSSPADIAEDVKNRQDDGILKDGDIKANWWFMVLDTDEDITATGTGGERKFTGKQYFLRREDDGQVRWMNNDYALHRLREDNYSNWTYSRLAESFRVGENDAFREGRWLWAFVGDDPYNMRVLNMETAVGVTADGEGIYTLEAADNCWTTITEQQTKDKDGNVTATSYPLSVPIAEPTMNDTWGLMQGNHYGSGEQTFNLVSTVMTHEVDGHTVNLPLCWQMATNSDTKRDSVAAMTRAKDRSNAIQLLRYVPTKYEDVKIVIRRKDEVDDFKDEKLALNKMTTGTEKLYFAAYDRKYAAGDKIDLSDKDTYLPFNVRRAFCDYALYKSDAPFDELGNTYTVKAGPYPTTTLALDTNGDKMYDDDGRPIYTYTSDGTESGTPADGAQAVYAHYVVKSDIFLSEAPTQAKVGEMAANNDHVFFMDFPDPSKPDTYHHAYFDPQSTFYEQTGDLKTRRDKTTGQVKTEKKKWNETDKKFVDDTDLWYNHYQYRTANNRMVSVPERLKWYFVGDPYRVQVYCTAGVWDSNNATGSSWASANNKEQATVAANLARFDESETNFQFVVDCVHLRVPDYSNIDPREFVEKHNEDGSVKMKQNPDGTLSTEPDMVVNRGRNKPYYNDFYWEVVPAASAEEGTFALRFKEDNDLLGYRNVYYYLAHDGLRKVYEASGDKKSYNINLSYNPDNATQQSGDYKGYHSANGQNNIIKLVQPAKVYVTVNRKADDKGRYSALSNVVVDELSEYFGVGETLTEVPRHLQRKFVSYDWTDKTLTASNATSIDDCNQPSGSTPIHQQTINDLMDSPVAKEKINPVFKFDVNYTVDDDTYDKEENKVVHYFTTKENFESGNLEWIDMAVAGTNWLYFDKNQSDLTQVSNYRTAVGDNTASGWNDGLKGLHWALVGDPYDFTIVNRRRYEDGSHSDAQWLAVTKTTIADWKGTVPNDSVIWTTSLKDYDTAVPSDAHSAATTPTAITDNTVNTHFALQMWKTGGDSDYFLRTASLKTSEGDLSNNKAGNQTNNYWRMVMKPYPDAGDKTSYFEMVPYALTDMSNFGDNQYQWNYSKTMNGLGVVQQRLEIRTAVAKDEDKADNNCFDADVEIRTATGVLRLTSSNMEIRYGNAFKSLPQSLKRYGCKYTKCYLNYGTENQEPITNFGELDGDEGYTALHKAMTDASPGRVKLTYIYEVDDAAAQFFTTPQDAALDEYTWMNTYFYWLQQYEGSQVEVQTITREFDHFVYNSAGQIVDEVWNEIVTTEIKNNPSEKYPTKGYLNTHTAQAPVYADETTQSENDRQKWSLTGDPYSFTMKNYAQYLKNGDATVTVADDNVLTQTYGATPFTIAVDAEGNPYLAVFNSDVNSPTFGNLLKLVDFEFSTTSDKSVHTISDTGMNPEDPTGNTLRTTYKNGSATVKPFFLANLIKYADVLVYHLVMAHQHSLDYEETGLTESQKTALKDDVNKRLYEFLKYWGIREHSNDSTYFLNYTAAGVPTGYKESETDNIKVLLKQKGTLRNFHSYPVVDQEVSRIGIGNRPQVPWYMKRQFCTYHMYQRDVMRSVVDIEGGQAKDADGNLLWMDEAKTKPAYNIKWVSIFDKSQWSDWDDDEDSEAEGDVKVDDKKQPSGYTEALGLQGTELDKLYDCHYNRKVIIDVVYEVNTNQFRFADKGRNTTAWYTMMTNNENDGLMNFTYLNGIGARLDRTHHYTNNYLWAPEGDPYGFVLRSRYSTINGTGWDDVAVTTKGKLPKGKYTEEGENKGKEKYISGTGAESVFVELTDADDVLATYTSRATTSGGIPFNNKRIIHRREGQDGAATDGATNAVYEMFVGGYDDSFLMHPTAAWMDNNDANHQSYYLKHFTAGNTTELTKTTSKSLLADRDANWRLVCTSEQLIPYFKRSGYVGGLDPLKAQSFTNQDYYDQLQQSIANNTPLSFSTLRKIQELVYSGTFKDNAGAEVSSGTPRSSISLPMTFESANLLNMKPGYYRIQAFSEDALNTDGKDLRNDGDVTKDDVGIVGPRYISGYRFKSETEDPDDTNNDGGRWLHFFETDLEHASIRTFADLKEAINKASTDGKTERDWFSHKAMRGKIEILPADFDPSSIFQFSSANSFNRYVIRTQDMDVHARPGGTEGSDASFGKTELNQKGSTLATGFDNRFRLDDIGGAAITLRTFSSEPTAAEWDDDVAKNLTTNYVCIDRNHRYRITCHIDNEMVEIGDHYTTDGLNGIQDTKWLLQPVGIREEWPYNQMPLRVEVQEGGVKNQQLTGAALTATENKDPYYYGSLYVPFDTRLSNTTDAAFTFTGKTDESTSQVTMSSVSQMNNMGNPQYVPATWPVILRTSLPSKVELKNQDGSDYATKHYVNMYLPYDAPQEVDKKDVKLQGEYLEQELSAGSDKTVMVFGLPFKAHTGVGAHEYDREEKQVGFYTNENWTREADNAYEATARTAADNQRNNKYVYHNKVYYLYSSPAPARRHIVAIFDGVDEPIDVVDRQDVPWPCDVYDLQGRRVAENETPGTLLKNHPALTKGVYIFGGRKVVVK